MHVQRKLMADLSNFVSMQEKIWLEATDLYALWFKAEINAEVGALSTNGTPATRRSQLTKAEVTAGMVMCEKMVDFYTNSAATTADYLTTMENLAHGSDIAEAFASVGLEALGERLASMSKKAIEALSLARAILAMYFAHDAGNVAIPDGLEMTSGQLSAGITLVEQYSKFCTNQSTSTANYSSTIGLWRPMFGV